MTDSQTIPDKFLQAAREAYHSAFNEHGEARDIDLYDAIAKAIHDAVMAERERCARIADLPGHSPFNIAAAIRRGV